MSPFAGYKNFDDCMAANSDRKDAAAYCATIMRRAEPNKDEPDDKVKPSDRTARHLAKMSARAFVPFFKSENIRHSDKDKNQVFGWASVAITKDGEVVDDLQGHTIDTLELEEAAYEFTKHYRRSGTDHLSVDQGYLIESMIFTPEKMEKMGIPPGTLPVGWWTGFQMPASTFAKVKSGKYKMFSIEGAARLVPIE